MRGLAGGVRWDGVPLSGAGLAGLVAGRSAVQQWQSPSGGAWLVAWGAAHRATDIGWCVDSEAGLVLACDATLYDRDTLLSDWGWVGPAPDTATLLLHGYQRWGETLPQRLDGDFAFAVFDLRNRSVFAATDPMGLRSLFHRALPEGGLAFATTPEALAVCTGLDPRIPESRLLEPLFNAEQLAHFEPDIPGVQRLMAAQQLQADARGMRVRRYWLPGQVRPTLGAGDVGGWVEGVRWYLADAVRKRLAGGVNAGLTFSGGLDSSAILALACTMATPPRITAYSVLDRSRADCPETRAIDRMLAAVDVPSSSIDVADMQAQASSARDALAASPRFVSGRNGFLSLFDRMAVESGIDVMMNGIDADAMFHYEGLLERRVLEGEFRDMLRNARKLDRLSGIVWMEPMLRRTRLSARLPWQLRTAARSVRGRLVEPRVLRAALLRDDVVARLGLRARVHAHRQLAASLGPPARSPPARGMMNPFTLDGIGRFQQRSRHFGLEMRCPFLDRALIDFSAWIPLDLRMRQGRLKWILRKAMSPLLPHAVAWRGDKFHPGSHFDRVMLQPVLEQAVLDFHGDGPAIGRWIDRDRFLAAARRWQAGQIDAVWELKMPLLLEHWLQHNADKVAFGR